MVGTAGGTVDGGSGINTLQIDPGLLIRQTGESRFNIVGSTAANANFSIAATDIQRIKVGSDVTAFDISGDAGQAYRLYQAAFARVPDVPGLSVNVNALDRGASLHDLAGSFIGSPEFVQRYGENLSNTNFISALYTNALHRAPDAAGLANWVNGLNAGVIDRATALAGFSESLENHLAVDPVLITGIHLEANYLTFA